MRQNYYKKLAHFYGNHQLSQNLMIHGSSRWKHAKGICWTMISWHVICVGHLRTFCGNHQLSQNLDDTWLFMLEARKLNLCEQNISWHVVCVGHLRNFVRVKYGQQILCHIFEDHTRNYFATWKTHEFNISHKTGNRNPTVMGLGKLAPQVHHPLEVEFSRSKLPLSQFVNPHPYMGTSISYPISRIYIPMFINFCWPCLQRQGYCV
jgi:hypothetical protein